MGEVTGAVLERIGDRPDLAMVFVTPPHAGALEDVMRTVEEVLHPLVSLGCAAESVVGPHREVEQDAAVSLFAGHIGPLVPLTLDAVPDGSGEGLVLRGWPREVPFAPEALFLVGDPYSFPAEAFLDWMEANHPGLRVVGGMASAARGPGGNRLAIGSRVRTAGAVGALLGPGTEVETLVSQGCRPFGDPLVVTKADGNLIYELAGRPALEQARGPGPRLAHRRGDGPPRDRGPPSGSGHRRAQGAASAGATSSSATCSGPTVPPGPSPSATSSRSGTTVQFHLRDAVTRRRGPPRPADRTPGRRRSRLHLQRPGHPAVRPARTTTSRVLTEHLAARPHGGLLRRRGARPGRRAELPPRLHGLGGVCSRDRSGAQSGARGTP